LGSLGTSLVQFAYPVAAIVVGYDFVRGNAHRIRFHHWLTLVARILVLLETLGVTIFVVLTIIADGGIRSFTAANEHEAIDAIKKLHGHVQRKHELFSIEFGPVTVVSFAGPSVRDADLQLLEKLPQLDVLHLINTQITDDGIARLKHCKNLYGLIIDNSLPSEFTPRGQETPRPRVTGKGLAALQELPGLQVVRLRGTLTKDEDLRYVHGLAGLLILDLTKTRVTDQGLTDLRQALPNLVIDMER
jgi:hypothetical protein